MHKLLGVFAVVVGAIFLLIPVLKNIPLNNFGSCLVLGLVVGGLVLIIKR